MIYHRGDISLWFGDCTFHLSGGLVYRHWLTDTFSRFCNAIVIQVEARVRSGLVILCYPMYKTCLNLSTQRPSPPPTIINNNGHGWQQSVLSCQLSIDNNMYMVMAQWMWMEIARMVVMVVKRWWMIVTMANLAKVGAKGGVERGNWMATSRVEGYLWRIAFYWRLEPKVAFNSKAQLLVNYKLSLLLRMGRGNSRKLQCLPLLFGHHPTNEMRTWVSVGLRLMLFEIIHIFVTFHSEIEIEIRKFPFNLEACRPTHTLVFVEHLMQVNGRSPWKFQIARKLEPTKATNSWEGGKWGCIQ